MVAQLFAFILQEPVCLSQLLSHLLFIVANGGLSSATALPDTFTTAYFATVAAMTPVPEEFVQDMQQRWGETVPPTSTVFDLLRYVSGMLCNSW